MTAQPRGWYKILPRILLIPVVTIGLITIYISGNRVSPSGRMGRIIEPLLIGTGVIFSSLGLPVTWVPLIVIDFLAVLLWWILTRDKRLFYKVMGWLSLTIGISTTLIELLRH